MPSAKRGGPDFGARVQRAVIPFSGQQAEPLSGALSVPLEHLEADPDQPRRNWSEPESQERLAELAASIAEFGIMQPLMVHEFEDEHGRARYRVIAGGRRLAAARQAGLSRVPVVVRSAEGMRLRILQLTENVQRQNLHPLDEARTFQELIDLEGLTPRALAERLHISDQQVRNRLRLLGNQPLADAMVRGQLSATAANLVLQLPDAGQQTILARLDAGEEITTTEVQRLRLHLDAHGVPHPRRTARPDRSREHPASEDPGDQSQQEARHGSASANDTASESLADPRLPHNPAVGQGGQPPNARLYERNSPDPGPASGTAEQGQNDCDPVSAEGVVTPDASTSGAPGTRRHRPTFIRLLEIERTLANLSLAEATEQEEARAWLAVLRQVATRATGLCQALERLHDNLLPTQEGDDTSSSAPGHDGYAAD